MKNPDQKSTHTLQFHLFKILENAGPLKGLSGTEFACQWRSHRRCRFNPWVRKIPWGEGMATYSSILAWEIPGQRSLGGYVDSSPRVAKSQIGLSTNTATTRCKSNVMWQKVNRWCPWIRREELSKFLQVTDRVSTLSVLMNSYTYTYVKFVYFKYNLFSINYTSIKHLRKFVEYSYKSVQKDIDSFLCYSGKQRFKIKKLPI